MDDGLSYKKAGVDIDSADAAKRAMAVSMATDDPRVLNRLGPFASLFDARFPGYEHPVLVLKMEEGLNIVVFPDTLKYFHFFGIEPEKKYIGIPVEVTGKIKMYKDRPEIIIRHPYSIRSLS